MIEIVLCFAKKFAKVQQIREKRKFFRKKLCNINFFLYLCSGKLYPYK